MDLLEFNGQELLKNMNINKKNNPPRTLINVVNEHVMILGVLMNGEYKIEEFYETPGAACALYFLLQKLIESGLIIETVRISSPIPNDGNMPRLINVYTEMGFSTEGTHGNPDLIANVNDLQDKLSQQCKVQGGGGRSKRSKRRKSKRRKSKRRKSKRRKTKRRS